MWQRCRRRSLCAQVGWAHCLLCCPFSGFPLLALFNSKPIFCFVSLASFHSLLLMLFKIGMKVSIHLPLHSLALSLCTAPTQKYIDQICSARLKLISQIDKVTSKDNILRRTSCSFSSLKYLCPKSQKQAYFAFMIYTKDTLLSMNNTGSLSLCRSPVVIIFLLQCVTVPRVLHLQ